MSAGVVRVPSRTQPGESYRVLVGVEGSVTCTCAGYEYRQSCWHVKYVKEELMSNNETALVPIKVRPPAALLPTRDELGVIGLLAKSVLGARGHAVPEAIDSPAKAFAIMLAGHELGVPPMTALRHIMVVNGKTEPDAQLMLGIVMAHEPDASVEVVELTEAKCTVRLRRPRRGIDAEYTYEFADAERAGLTKPSRSGLPSNWVKFPKDMLRHAATKRICRAYASDLINNVGAVDAAAAGSIIDAIEGDIIDQAPDDTAAAIAALPESSLYSEGDAPDAPVTAHTIDVDPETGEILGADEGGAPDGGDEGTAPEPVAPIATVLAAQDWVKEAARKAKVTAVDVMEALGLEADMPGYERMALDLAEYQGRWDVLMQQRREAEQAAKQAARADTPPPTANAPTAAPPPATSGVKSRPMLKAWAKQALGLNEMQLLEALELSKTEDLDAIAQAEGGWPQAAEYIAARLGVEAVGA